MRRIMMSCLVLALFFGLCACKKVKMETMTLTEFGEFCLSDSNLDCEEACGAVQSNLRPDFATAAQCRAACDKAGNDFLMQNAMDNCEGSVQIAVRMCSQYCDGHFPK